MSDDGAPPPDPIFTRTWKRVDAARRELLLSTKLKVAERLKGVCDYMAWDEFDAFVTRVAELENKYSMRRSSALLRPTVTSGRTRQDRI
jgi:hypothetical protein